MAQRSAAEARWARVGGVGRQGSTLYITRYPRVLLPRPDPVIPPRSRCCEISPFRGAKGGAEITKHKWSWVFHKLCQFAFPSDLRQPAIIRVSFF